MDYRGEYFRTNVPCLFSILLSFKTGFQIVYLVDGGTTGVMRSGRIRKDTQGKGVLRKLGEFIMEQNTSLTHVVFATGTNVPTIFQNIRNGEYQFVAKRVLFIFYQYLNHIWYDCPSGTSQADTKMT